MFAFAPSVLDDVMNRQEAIVRCGVMLSFGVISSFCWRVVHLCIIAGELLV